MQKLSLSILVITLAFFSSTSIVKATIEAPIDSFEWVRLVEENNELKNRVQILEEEITVNKRAIDDINSSLKSNSEMFNIYKDYVKDLLFTLVGLMTVGGTLLVVIVQFYTKASIINKISDHIRNHINDEKILEIILPTLDKNINNQNSRVDSLLHQYEMKFTEMLKLLRRG